MFEDDTFHLPQNIFYTDKGLLYFTIPMKLPLMLKEQKNYC
jgi:hypothetical protein